MSSANACAGVPFALSQRGGGAQMVAPGFLGPGWDGLRFWHLVLEGEIAFAAAPDVLVDSLGLSSASMDWVCWRNRFVGGGEEHARRPTGFTASSDSIEG